MDNIYGNYDSSGNLVGVFRNSGDIAPFTATDTELEDCCCGCGQDVKESVAERQKAVGATSIDTSKTWTLSELQTKVNNIAPDYVDGTYTGGTSKPTMLSSSYADSAATCDELFTLVKGMLQTKFSVSISTNVDNQASAVGKYVNGCDSSALNQARTAVEDAWPGEYSRGDQCEIVGCNVYDTDFVNPMGALAINGRSETSVSVSTSDISHNFMLFGYADTFNTNPTYNNSSYSTTFSNQGLSYIPPKFEYGKLKESGSTTNTSWTSPKIGLPETTCPNWPNVTATTLTNNEGTSYNYGCQLEDFFVVVDWDFTYQ